MTDPFLTEAELYKLTKKQRPSAQARALRFMGIEHRPRADGSIVVLRSHVEAELGGKPGTRTAEVAGPDLSWM